MTSPYRRSIGPDPIRDDEPPMPIPDRTGLIEHVLAVTLVATFAGGFVFAIVGAWMGAIGVSIASRWGETAGSIGGSASVGLFVGAIPRLVMGRNRNLLAASAWMIVFGGTAFAVIQYLPSNEEWWILRWATISVGFGVIILGLSDPIRWLRTMGPEKEGLLILFLFRQIAVAIVTAISTGRIGSTVAGGVGAMVGSTVAGIFLTEAGEDQFMKFIGNTWMVIFGCTILGTISGAINGWQTWPRVTNFEQLERFQLPEAG